ncbi:MAG: ABC transporter ATP-binding protein [Mitsuaria chitosanitabida]|uniref:ABC transporter ATP-binding protein n=1 Tax=Roseateles chitosanitabidus TaxID=65048 RepID=UPI001B136F8B|nr:ABC transporter ATP-binding protein [Roseateles chitosanitabidus]MBO9685193.1 ABC transporter ATP-binding protein [Roseateles chitosanitabidus]
MTEPTRGVAAPAVRLCDISKRFGAVQANRAVSLSVMPGTVHGLVGENGAGKSTLMAILYGYYHADEGHIEVDGQRVSIANSHQAIALGIGMVHQHFMLVDTLSALDNVMLGAEPAFFLSRAKKQVRRELEALMRDTGLTVRLDATVADLPVGELQRLEILKALYRGARILILDEPTAVLTPQETDQLFEVLRRLRERGTTILLITHKLREVMALCDAVTVMRAGTVIETVAIGDTSPEALAESMVGRKVNLGRDGGAAKPHSDQPVLRAEGLTVASGETGSGVHLLSNATLSLRPGEIVGVAGVSGNGQSELLEVLAGMRAPDAGTLHVAGRDFHAASWMDPSTARDLKLAHVPEDRHALGMVLSFPAWETAALGYHEQDQYRAGPFGLGMDQRHLRAKTAEMMERFDVRPRNAELGSSKFSGGNQQKLILAREIGQQPAVLLVGQPTRGVDIGAIEFIHNQLRRLRDAGCAVLLVSSELDEILALADRVVVMNAGRITGELAIEDCSEKNLGLLMAASPTQEKTAA